MGLSSIAVQQREKEVKSLKSFLAFSLVGSLALHIGLLASGIGNLLSRTPDLAEEPLEVVIVDPPKVEEVKPQPEPQRQTQPSKAAVVSPGSSRIGGQPKAVPRTVPQPQPRVAPSPAVVAEKQPETKPEPTQELAESLKPEPAPPPKPAPAAPPVVTNAPQPNPAAPPAVTNAPSNPAAPAIPNGGSGQGQQSVATGNGNNTSGTPQGSGSGSIVAAGPGTARQGTPQGRGRGEGDAEGSGSGRLACRECAKPKYPEKARRRGVEGTAKVKLEVDEKGNVTDVKIAESSGNAALDEAAVRAASKWKLENPKRSTQGIVAKVDFALEGSERARRAEERQRRRTARKKRRTETANDEKKAPTAANSSPPPSQAAAPKPQQPQSLNPPQQPASSTQNRLREALRRPRLPSAPSPQPAAQ